MTVNYEDAKAMEAVLRKLEEATNNSVNKVLNEDNKTSSRDDAIVALNTSRTEAGVNVANYTIKPTKLTIGGIRKNYYDIVENDTGEVLYKELSLFESAMSITKRLMLGKRLQDCDTIAQMDEAYDSRLLEAYNYKERIKIVTESVKRDVYEAKYSNAMAKVKDAKQKIIRTL